MKSIIKNPATNAICIIILTIFYALIFIITSGNMEFKSLLYYSSLSNHYDFWTGWSNFLANGHHAYIAYVLIAITVLVAILLLLRRRPYDEYHTANLVRCLAIAAVLTLVAIGLFYLMILSDSNGIVEKFTLFIVIHWATIVLADLVFVLVCRWR